MTELNVIVGVINVHAALLGICLSIPLIQRKVQMNHWHGIRIKKAFESDEHWYRINVYGGKWMIAVSGLLLVAGLLAFFIPSPDGLGLTHVAWIAPLLLVFVSIADICRYARKL